MITGAGLGCSLGGGGACVTQIPANLDIGPLKVTRHLFCYNLKAYIYLYLFIQNLFAFLILFLLERNFCTLDVTVNCYHVVKHLSPSEN